MRPLQILLVDDNDLARRAIERVLRRDGFDCAAAASVDDAWPMIGGCSAVLTDLHMPDVNGVEFLRRLRGNPQYRRLPVAVFTSDLMTDGSMRDEIVRLDALFFELTITPADFRNVTTSLASLVDIGRPPPA